MMFKLDVNYLDYLNKTAQKFKKIEDPLKELSKLGLQSSCTVVVSSGKNQWSGSGFHIGDGNIITAAHVVPPDAQISQIKITFDNQNFFDAEIVKSEPQYDAAVLYCDEAKRMIPALQLGNSDSLEVGDLVVVVSAPEGFHDTVTFGRVSNIHQSVQDYNSPAWQDIIFIDADILEGSSGGMVLGTDGLVYGIVIGITGHHAEMGLGEQSVCPSNKIKMLFK